MPRFARYVGIDYSGARTPTSGLTGLRVCSATPARRPLEVRPVGGLGKHWTRRSLAEWIAGILRDGPPTLVGIDHALSFPLRYFDAHGLPHDWDVFLDDFCRHWPTDRDDVAVEMVRRGVCGEGAARGGDARWRRLAEERCGAKSVFHFDVQGSVAKSTHSGLPWVRSLRRSPGARVHFWPFDGWSPAAGLSVIAEVYPALWTKPGSIPDENPHLRDARGVADWMRNADRKGLIENAFHPHLAPSERVAAAIEGWILGVE